MTFDKFGNPIYQEIDLIDLIYSDNLSGLEKVLVKSENSICQFESHSNLNLKKVNYTEELSIEQFDKNSQADWFIPEDYKNLDIESYLVTICPEDNYQRLIDELQEFRARNMLMLLRTLKYLIDTLKANNIIWGVGRGSSVSSYVLYLLGVHKIDSIKYNLDWKEFLR